MICSDLLIPSNSNDKKDKVADDVNDKHSRNVHIIRNIEKNVSINEIKHVPFASYSCNTHHKLYRSISTHSNNKTNNNNNNNRINDQIVRHSIVCGGARSNESQTYQLILDKNSHTFVMNNINLDLKNIGCHYGFNIISLLTNDSEKLIIIKPFNGIYNIYNFKKQQWLIDKNNKLKIFDFHEIGETFQKFPTLQ